MTWLEVFALAASWATLGTVGAFVVNEGWRWEFGENAKSGMLLPFMLCGLTGFVAAMSVSGRDCLRFWKHGRRSQDEVERAAQPIDISQWFTSFSATTGQAAASFRALSQALEEVAEPPVEEAWTPEPVLAWRWWTLDVERLFLIGNVSPWESGTIEAEHVGDTDLLLLTRLSLGLPAPKPHRKAPHPGCMCGVNALKASEVYGYAKRLFDPYPGIFRTNPDPIHVVGRVALTGVVDEYEKGYRAEKAEIIELVVLSEAPVFKVPGVLDALEERYGVRPGVQSRESWLAEMEVIHGYGKEDQADHLGAGADSSGAASGTGQGASQDFLSARLNRWSAPYMVPDDEEDDGLSGVTNA